MYVTFEQNTCANIFKSHLDETFLTLINMTSFKN